jgi:hypothetical protein
LLVSTGIATDWINGMTCKTRAEESLIGNERHHNEIGAPDFRILSPFGVVLTPWDYNLFPVLGPVAAAHDDSHQKAYRESRLVAALNRCGLA